MSTILRVYGTEFDVDAYLAVDRGKLPICAVHRRGEPMHRKRQYERSGLHIVASDAEFDDFPRQVEETTEFLRTHAAPLRQLGEFPGVEDMTLDFGVNRRDVWGQFDFFPPELVRLAGQLGLGIELSSYAISQESPGDECASDPAKDESESG